MFKEWKAVIKKPFFIIAVVAVILIPSLYNLIFLNSMWNPYGMVNQLPVAVVNEDKAATFNGQQLEIGDSMVESMKDSKALDFRFVDKTEAQKGLKSGKYYMVVTLPDNLSEKAASLLTENPEQANIRYQTSAGHSFIASKMSETAMNKLDSSVSETITQTYVRALFTNVNQLKDGLTTAADRSQQLTDGAAQLQNGTDTLTKNLQKLASSTQTLSDGSATLANGLGTYTNGVSTLNQGLGTLDTGLSTYTTGVTQLADGANRLNNQTQALNDGMAQLASSSSQMQPLVDGTKQLNQGLNTLSSSMELSAEQSQTLAQLQAALPQLNQAIQSLPTGESAAELSAYLTSLSEQLTSIEQSSQADKEASIAALQSTTVYQSLTAEQQAELTTAVSGSTSSSASQISEMRATIQSLQTALSALSGTDSNNNLATLKATANQVLPGAASAITTLSSGLSNAKSAIDTQLIPASGQIASGVSTLQEQVTSGAGQLQSGVSAYTDGVSQVAQGINQLNNNSSQLTSGAGQLVSGASQLAQNSSQLVSGSTQLKDGAVQIADGATKLADGEQVVSNGLGTLSEGSASLSQGLQTASDKLTTTTTNQENADALSSPVTMTHVDHDNVPTNGYAMTPYMASAALFVAAIATNTLFAKLPSGTKTRMEELRGRLQINGVMAVVSAVVLDGALHWMGLQPNHEGKTLLILIAASLSFMALTTMLNTIDNKVGAFLSLIILMLQLATSQGTYPGQLSAPIYSTLNPFLPMSYAVSGLRQTISMTGAISGQLIFLFGSALVFTLIGYLISRPQRRGISETLLNNG